MPIQSPSATGFDGQFLSTISSNMSGRSSNRGSSNPGIDRAKMEAFRKIKPTCVTLMSLAPTPPTSYSAHTGLVDTLTRHLTSLPPESLTTGMINYTLFPITQILRHHNPVQLPDIFLESTFRLLAHIVGIWKDHEGGMEIGAWEQLWRFVTAAIARTGIKGKEREVGQEVQLQAVNLLSALLYPTQSHPTPQMLDKVSSPKASLMPTLFQTITLLLATIDPVPPRTELQLSALRLLRSLVKVYLKDQHSVLASVLPGTVSSVSKLFNARVTNIKGEVCAQAAGLVEDVIVSTLSDTDLRRLGVLRSGLENLSQLAEEWTESDPSDAISPIPDSTPSSGKDLFPPLTKSYLDFTSAQLLTALRPILSILSAHASHLARSAASSLSFALLQRCHQSLSQLTPHALSTLLLLTRDDFDSVRVESSDHLQTLFNYQSSDLDTSLMDLLSEAINALPRLIKSHQESKVKNAAKLLMAISEISSSSTQNPIADLLGPRGKVERWGWALLDCLEFGKPTGWSTGSTRTAEKAWENRLVASDLPLQIEGGEGCSSFPALPLRYIESEATIRILGETMIALGSVGGESALHAVEHFLLFAKSNSSSNVSKAVSALWVAQKLFDGIATGQVEGSEGKVSKAARKMARDITRIVVAVVDEDDSEDEEDVNLAPPPADEESEALIPVERTTGLDQITTLLDRPTKGNSSTANETRRLHLQSQRILVTAVSLSSLSLTSRILSSSFRPLLLNLLYTLLSHLSSPHSLISTYAEIALSHVAYNSGYASIQNLLLDNVDYVINTVSQHLRPSRLSPSAPLVLIAMIRLTRSEIVPMVHDLIDEVFDALDDYHGYEILASGLLAVLVSLVDVMSEDVATEGITKERKAKLEELDRIGKPPNPEEDWARFKKWWIERQKRRNEEIGDILDRAPQHAWGKDKQKDATQEEEKPPNGDDEEIPATRAQEICTLILDKSINFLSHGSPFLRARILSLITHSISVLALGNREGDLLPLIDRFWGIILLRLDDPYPYVVVEATEVIAELCAHCGDFMSRKILDHAWPKFQKILINQIELDKGSALGRKGGIGTESRYTISHRLYLAIIGVGDFIAKKVPVDDGVLWDMMVRFRIFLDERGHEELQKGAMELYSALGRRDGDALWTCLKATQGDSEVDGGKGLWNWLRDLNLRISVNATKLLAEL